MKRILVLILIFSLTFLLMAGCSPQREQNAPTEPSSTAPPTEIENPPSGKAPDLISFEARLNGQGALTLALFCQNYEDACALYAQGIRAEEKMPQFNNDSVFSGPRDDAWLKSGFYMISLEEAIFGISNFYVIPAGERALTAEEYLELAEAAAGIPSQELVREERSWIPLQDREIPDQTRQLSVSENRWLVYELSEILRRRDAEEAPADAPVLIPVGAEKSYFWIYPKERMSGTALQAVAQWKYLRNTSLAGVLPPANADWDAIINAAKSAMEQHGGRADAPAADYIAYRNLKFNSTDRHDQWRAALYYSDGSSYLVTLDGPELNLHKIEQMPDGYYDLNGDWDAFDPNYDPIMIYAA